MPVHTDVTIINAFLKLAIGAFDRRTAHSHCRSALLLSCVNFLLVSSLLRCILPAFHAFVATPSNALTFFAHSPEWCGSMSNAAVMSRERSADTTGL